MTRSALLAAAAALSLSACAATVDEGGDGSSASASAAAGDMTPETASAFVPMAASSDTFEINSSQLALQRATGADTRAYAQMMIRDHSNTTQQLSAAARTSGIEPPPPGTMLPMHQALFEQLQNAGTGAAFDRTYWTLQAQSHQMALDLHSNYARNGDQPALRQVAQTATPIVRMHLEEARQKAR
ncbi:MAG: hypothetical protein AVDCRST_MAG39-894 [uncultured Sphingomonadaceae bacterium]|uniref:DUF4142 domain-containing protein n=1 Tax=uncultured Sphingomonadaceae bacterium TaxID=169976 RepID=A0A6J4S8Z0_9SPHN|nr:MAG: hypothetical protein AVDCRST_MAG39-894 [uncultured Sphingomonadaceae bacterium]